MNKKTWIIISIIFLRIGISEALAQDKLLGILKQEMKKQMEELKTKEFPPYYMNYRVIEEHNQTLRTSFGALIDKKQTTSSIFVPQIRIGSSEKDNFENEDMGTIVSLLGPTFERFPIEKTGDEDAIREAIWRETNRRYEYALDMLKKRELKSILTIANDDKSPCFSAVPVEHYYEAPIPKEKLSVNEELWAKRLEEISAIFKKYPNILDGNANLVYKVARNYFVNTEGTEIVHNLSYIRIIISGATMAEDGMMLPLNCSYFAFTPEGLPSNADIIKDVERLAKTLEALRNAPVAEAYTGPVVLSGEASGVFFHEIFGHRIEGQRMKNESDGQTFKKMVGQLVLPKAFQVYDDPSLKKYREQDLNGYYIYDDQGVKGERVNVVVDGKMNDFLMTRKPIEGFPKSNGHGRSTGGFDPVSRQSNLVIETTDPKSDAELRKLLLEEVKAQGKTYGYFIKEVNGGFTNISVQGINSFNVTPLETYRVYLDGRPDELVRGVDLIGTPLAMFSGIVYGGELPKVFTGMCGAESGWVPVTAVSPSILVKKVETQSKAKSKMLPPIIGKPTTAKMNAKQQ